LAIKLRKVNCLKGFKCVTKNKGFTVVVIVDDDDNNNDDVFVALIRQREPSLAVD
jgi:hypothetical protein